MHSIICGSTLTGKTTLALILAREAKKRGIKSMAYDTKRAGYCCDIICESLNRFLDIAQASNNMMLFVDDCISVLRSNDPRHRWLTAEARHRGHSVVLIGQRYKNIPKTNRDNCETLWMFRQSLADCKEIAGDFAYDWHMLRPGDQPLPRLKFFKISPRGIQPGSVDPVTGLVYMKKIDPDD
jgi:hypothetical protein